MGATRCGASDQRDAAEADLAQALSGRPQEEVLGAAKGLEALFRQEPRRVVSDDTRARLRALTTTGPRVTGAAAAAGDTDARIRRLAMQALMTARDEDLPTLTRASADADWQVRRLVEWSTRHAS